MKTIIQQTDQMSHRDAHAPPGDRTPHIFHHNRGWCQWSSDIEFFLSFFYINIGLQATASSRVSTLIACAHW